MTERPYSDREVGLPPAPIGRFLGPLARFLHIEAGSGVLLLVCTGIALGLANSPWSDAWLDLWKTPAGFAFGDFAMTHSLKHWINDGLMGLFFFVIGLEVKREMVLGELRDPRRAALPIAAALGGMIAPAGLYLLLQAGEPGARGWGIPMATDIAFVVGCLAIMGERVPRGLRVLLLSLAIADDIGAILVIAIGYTAEIHMEALLWAVAGMAFVLVLSRVGVRSLGVYVLVGGGVWLGFHESGIHATIAGVLLGLVTPVEAWVPHSRLENSMEAAWSFFKGEGWQSPDRLTALRELESTVRETQSPLERIEIMLHPWSSFVIMPLFALANAGVVIQVDAFTDPVAIAILVGLVVGKPLGIVLVSFLAVRAGLAQLPEGVGWGALVGGGCLAGIGFTMALFIAGLALEGPILDAAKIGILTASVIAAVLGLTILLLTLRPAVRPTGAQEPELGR